MGKAEAAVAVGARVAVTSEVFVRGHRTHLIEAWGTVESSKGRVLGVRLDSGGDVIYVAAEDCEVLDEEILAVS